MSPTTPRTPELVLPAASVAALRRSLIEQLGPDAASVALQRAGHAAGDAFFGLLAQSPDGAGDEPGQMPEHEFWRKLNDLLAARGWGHLHYERAHEGVGAIVAEGWAESDAAEAAARPSCFLSTGLFSNLLGRVAGREVGVFEVECRSRGDAHCRFLFGGAEALESIYHSIVAGQDASEALASLR